MANKKPTKTPSTKPKSAATKPAKTTTVAKEAKTTIVRDKPASRGWYTRILAGFKKELTPEALLAEFGGTLLLTCAVLFLGGDPFFTGLTVVILAAGIFVISGANLNPAVTFGLWASRAITIYRALLYWLAQFLGALAALLLIYLFSGTLEISLASFWQTDARIFFAELIGTAIFLFGLVAAVKKPGSELAKAARIGTSLFLGLMIASGLLSTATQAESRSLEQTEATRLQKVNNSATLNPAVALAVTERAPSSSITGLQEADPGTPASRLTLETLGGTFIGAVIGGYAYRLISRRDEV